MAAAVCALTALLLTVAPAAAQEVPDTSGRPHRAMVDVGFGYGYLDSASAGDHRFTICVTGAYMVPLGQTDFDLGIRGEFGGLGAYTDPGPGSGAKVNQQQAHWLLALRLDWLPRRLQELTDGVSLQVAPYVFLGGGKVRFTPTYNNSVGSVPPDMNASAFQAGIGLYAGAGFNYAAPGHRRILGLYLGPELSLIRSFGRVDSTAVVFNLFKGGFVF